MFGMAVEFDNHETIEIQLSNKTELKDKHMSEKPSCRLVPRFMIPRWENAQRTDGIIEFCKEQRESGLSILESASSAARLRFRPIMMTIISFLLGTLPLAMATGAGAVSMRSIGVVIVGGMIAATFVSTLLVPVIYVLLETLREKFVSVEEEVLV